MNSPFQRNTVPSIGTQNQALPSPGKLRMKETRERKVWLKTNYGVFLKDLWKTLEFFNNFKYSEVSNKRGVPIRHVVGNVLYLLHKKTVFEAGFLEINKHGGSNKACSWEIVLKKNKKTPCQTWCLLETSEYFS